MVKSKVQCEVVVFDTDVRSPRSFRRDLCADFTLEDSNAASTISGVLVRTFDGFAVESIDRNDFNYTAEKAAELLLEVHEQAGLNEEIKPHNVLFTFIDIIETGGIMFRTAEAVRND